MNRLLPHLLLTAIFSMMFIGNANAQTCKVVRPNYSAGSHTGDDWTNAYNGVPTALVRGTVYYLADGAYGQATFSSASGSGWIEVRKAQSYDHCTDTGWNAATMGNSQAVFSRGNGGQAFAVWLSVDQVILNGNGTYASAGCGGGPSSATDVTSGPVNPKDCGIKIVNSCTNTGTNSCDNMIAMTGSASSWKFLYNEWQGLGNAQQEQYPTNSGVANNNSSTRLFQHIYGHDFGANILVGQGHREVDHCYWWGNQRIQYPSNHGQYSYDGFLSPIVGISEHHSVYRDIQGTAIWGIEDGPQVASNINIYDNIIMSTSPQLPWVNIGVNNGSLWCGNGSTCSNVNYVNNTHVNVIGQAPVPHYQDAGTSTSNVTMRDNLWYNAIGAGWQFNMSGTQDHNSFLNSGSSICVSGTSNVCTQSSPNPFTNMAGLDFTLSSDNANWDNRVPLGASYDTDAEGNQFTSSRGAYQFGSTTTQVNPPSGLTATVN